MAKIWYSVCGEGMGHAVRSEPFIRHFKKKHKILITSYGKPYDYLKSLFPKNTIKITGNYFYYTNNKINLIRTVLLGILFFPFRLVYNLIRLRDIIAFRPTHIISDFETFSHFYAYITKTKFLSLTNNRIITKAKHPIKPPFYFLPIMRYLLYPDSGKCILIFFSDLKLIKKAKIFLPILRDEIKTITPKEKEHILVYQTSNTNLKLISNLDKTNLKYIIYGFNKKKIKNKNPNLIFKDFNEHQFITDLAESKFLITNGGISTIFEALYLGKPILSNPIENHYEQILNAYYLDKSGYGKYVKNINIKEIINFNKNYKTYKKRIRKLNWDSKPLIFELDSFLK
jgi:uncharacterized protein (TIGR00661 family)